MFRRKEQTTGMIPNPEQDQDPRNLSYEEMSVSFGGEIPKEGDVTKHRKEILNQGGTYSCTTHSTAGAVHQTTGNLLSPRWGYWRIKTDSKYLSSTIPLGAYMKDSVSVFTKEGVCDYGLLPNGRFTGSETSYLAVEDTKEMHESAKRNAGGSYVYATLNRNSIAIFDATIKYMFEQQRPVKMGARWYGEYNKARGNGIIPAEFPGGIWFGHDMIAVAWKEINGEPYIGLIQSWGPNWGDKGMCWMPRNFSYFFSPIAYVPPEKEKELKIEKTVDAMIENRSKHRERANAQELTAQVEHKFPLDVEAGARAANAVAREIFGREKMMFTLAVAYLEWDFTDVINHLYARSRGKNKTKAYSLNFKLRREDEIKK